MKARPLLSQGKGGKQLKVRVSREFRVASIDKAAAVLLFCLKPRQEEHEPSKAKQHAAGRFRISDSGNLATTNDHLKVGSGDHDWMVVPDFCGTKSNTRGEFKPL
jgi:hypothetical protein